MRWRLVVMNYEKINSWDQAFPVFRCPAGSAAYAKLANDFWLVTRWTSRNPPFVRTRFRRTPAHNLLARSTAMGTKESATKVGSRTGQL